MFVSMYTSRLQVPSLGVGIAVVCHRYVLYLAVSMGGCVLVCL